MEAAMKRCGGDRMVEDPALSQAEAARYRCALVAQGFGPVDVRRCPEGPAGRYLLDVRIGPFRRVAASATDVLVLLEERQARYF
jgi:hypothetical protein